MHMEHHRSSNPVRADGFARASSAMPMRILGTVLALALGGCFQTIRPSDSHLKQEVPPPPSAATIPAPVQVTTALPKPKPTVKAETYSVVVNNVRVQELLFALARDANMNIDVHPGIAGSVTLNAIDQTLPQLLSRIGKQVDNAATRAGFGIRRAIYEARQPGMHNGPAAHEAGLQRNIQSCFG